MKHVKLWSNDQGLNMVCDCNLNLAEFSSLLSPTHNNIRIFNLSWYKNHEITLINSLWSKPDHKELSVNNTGAQRLLDSGTCGGLKLLASTDASELTYSYTIY